MKSADSLRDLADRINHAGIWNILWAFIITALIAFIIPGTRPDLNEDHFTTLGVARDHLFNFAEWEVNAVADKTANALLQPQRYMTPDEQTEFVRDYFGLVNTIHDLETQISAIYIDPEVTDPEAESADLRAERDRLRAIQQEQQALAEAIIQEQVSELLEEYGFGVAGQIAPPVASRFTQLPTILIVSPRDHIERTGAYPLEHGLTVDQMEKLEDEVDEELDVSSIIEPLGGLAVYPAMLIETGYLPHITNVAAHEWTHHYLSFFPLGFNYGKTPALYTINETVASIVGTELGWAVLDRYYPDLAPAPPDWTPVEPEPPSDDDTEEPPAFDYRAAMHETRVTVDAMLADGEILRAEAYMEARRRMFVERGYRIRKLNQAYFAFHGAYADEPGATGSDPIGPALRELRYYSASLKDFIERVRGMTTFEEVQAELEDARREAGG